MQEETKTQRIVRLMEEYGAMQKYKNHFRKLVLSGLATDTSESPKRKIYQLILSKIVISNESDQVPGYYTTSFGPMHIHAGLDDEKIAEAFQAIRTNYSSTDPLNLNREHHADFDITRNIMNRIGIMNNDFSLANNESKKFHYNQVYGVFIHEQELLDLSVFMTNLINKREAVIIEDLKAEGIDLKTSL